jgi:hypothetical protein
MQTYSGHIDLCPDFCIFGSNKKNMGQNAPRYELEKLPPLREKVETIEILRQTNKSIAAKSIKNYLTSFYQLVI